MPRRYDPAPSNMLDVFEVAGDQLFSASALRSQEKSSGLFTDEQAYMCTPRRRLLLFTDEQAYMWTQRLRLFPFTDQMAHIFTLLTLVAYAFCAVCERYRDKANRVDVILNFEA